jgi:hypothetical protein
MSRSGRAVQRFFVFAWLVVLLGLTTLTAIHHVWIAAAGLSILAVLQIVLAVAVAQGRILRDRSDDSS